MTRVLLASLAAVLLVACSNCGAAPPEDSSVPVPPRRPPPEPGMCFDACINMKALRCPQGRPSPEGEPCTSVCLDSQEGPAELRWDVVCMAKTEGCFDCLGE